MNHPLLTPTGACSAPDLTSAQQTVREAIRGAAPDVTVCLSDSFTARFHPLILPESPLITIGAGESHKDLSSLAEVWRQMQKAGMSRRSLLINLGGGMVSDTGGFAAATFKRGIRYINLPTTLLAAVDASIGGKTAIDFEGLKNQIGSFHIPLDVIPLYPLIRQLPSEEILSGYGEMLKTAMLISEDAYGRMARLDPLHCNADELQESADACARFKRQTVDADPREGGVRQILNLGHTAGHAFEALAMERSRPVPHGVCVAHGLLVSLILSRMLLGFPSTPLYAYARLLRTRFPRLPMTCADNPRLAALALADKKNHAGLPAGACNFVLLQNFGEPRRNMTVSHGDLLAALDIYRDLVG